MLYNSPLTRPQLLQKGVPAYLFGGLNMLQGNARGYVTQTALGSMGVPTAPAGTPDTSSGTLAANTYYAKIVAINATGHTAGGTESAPVVLASTGNIAWTWTAVAGAVSYQIWVGTSSGTENTFATSATNSYTQTAALTSGTIPATDTTNVASVSVFINQGPLPLVGDQITVWGTAQQSGAFNVTRAIITAVSITAATGQGTISFALTGTNQSRRLRTLGHFSASRARVTTRLPTARSRRLFWSRHRRATASSPFLWLSPSARFLLG